MINTKQIVKITNGVALVAVGLLSFWVFIFVSITVFQFKVFRENMTEAFYLSIFGILSLLVASIILNVMLNMTRIADHFDGTQSQPTGNTKRFKLALLGLLFTFPLTFLLLYLGDARSAAQKRNYLVQSGKDIITEKSDLVQSFTNYKFSEEYIKRTEETLRILSGTDENFPAASVIVQDKINGQPVFLQFNQYSKSLGENEKPYKTAYLYAASTEERKYLNDVFQKKIKESKFSANNGTYELYYPVSTPEQTIVIYFSDQSQYGKIGS